MGPANMPGGHFFGSAVASRGHCAASWNYFLENAVYDAVCAKFGTPQRPTPEGIIYEGP